MVFDGDETAGNFPEEIAGVVKKVEVGKEADAAELANGMANARSLQRALQLKS